MDNTSKVKATISSVEEIVSDIAKGRIVILVDEEDRENEGDLVLAADYVTPEAINFMAKLGRGLICLTLTQEHCQKLNLSPMVAKNGTRYSTAFTVSIEAAHGVTTGISAADRAKTIQAAVAPNATASDLVQPGHVFPLQAVDGGVLMRAGHTEAGCDLAALANCSPAAVICEIMNDDGEMARLPELQVFAAQHGLKIGTIADLIAYRSRTETLVKHLTSRQLITPWGEFTAHAYLDTPSQSFHLALRRGQWDENTNVLVRVHEPLSLMDVLDTQRSAHSWSLGQALEKINERQAGIVVLLNCGQGGADLFAEFTQGDPLQALSDKAPHTVTDLRTYGIGAQILRDCHVRKMTLMASPRRMPSMTGYGLEVTDYLQRTP